MGKFEEMIGNFEQLDADEKKQLLYKLTQNANREEVNRLQEQLEKISSTTERIAIKNRIHMLTTKQSL